MIWWIYNMGIWLMIFGLKIHSIFNSKSKKGLDGRRKMPIFSKKKGKRIIVHCASLGEYEQAKPIIEKCRKAQIEVVLTFFSPSGYEILKDSNAASYIAYLPFDLPNKVLDFLAAAEPDLVVIIKYEFWWNLIKASYPVIFASVVLREDHYLFKWWARPFLQTLREVRSIFLIDQNSYDLLTQHEFRNHFLAGDTRVESILVRKEVGIEDEVLKGFCGDANVIIFGSTYAVEHDEIVKMSDLLQEKGKVLIFPHDINQKEIFSLKERLGKDCIIYSEWKERPLFHGHNMMIIDTIGLLKDAYRFANLAYIGGGFSNGIHSILEPFVYKMPLIFGPNFQKFPEATFLAKQEFVKIVDEVGAIRQAITTLTAGDYTSSIEDNYTFIFEENGQASTQIVEKIKNDLWKQGE